MYWDIPPQSLLQVMRVIELIPDGHIAQSIIYIMIIRPKKNRLVEDHQME